MVALVVPESVPLSAEITAKPPGGGESGATKFPLPSIVPWHGVVAPGAGATQSPPGKPFTCQATLPAGLPPAVAVKACIAPAPTAGPPGEICSAWEAVTLTMALPVAPCEVAVTTSFVVGTVAGAV